MTESPFEQALSQVEAARKAGESVREQLRDYLRQDHVWLYEIIANPELRVMRQAHWTRKPKMEFDPDEIGCADLPVETANGR